MVDGRLHILRKVIDLCITEGLERRRHTQCDITCTFLLVWKWSIGRDRLHDSTDAKRVGREYGS